MPFPRVKGESSAEFGVTRQCRWRPTLAAAPRRHTWPAAGRWERNPGCSQPREHRTRFPASYRLIIGVFDAVPNRRSALLVASSAPRRPDRTRPATSTERRGGIGWNGLRSADGGVSKDPGESASTNCVRSGPSKRCVRGPNGVALFVDARDRRTSGHQSGLAITGWHDRRKIEGLAHSKVECDTAFESNRSYTREHRRPRALIRQPGQPAGRVLAQPHVHRLTTHPLRRATSTTVVPSLSTSNTAGSRCSSSPSSTSTDGLLRICGRASAHSEEGDNRPAVDPLERMCVTREPGPPSPSNRGRGPKVSTGYRSHGVHHEPVSGVMNRCHEPGPHTHLALAHLALVPRSSRVLLVSWRGRGVPQHPSDLIP
jgi:hypothetical protein